ncbi:MAG TPA: KpsF/GutQ family sugar-phosphate isomerase [Chitinophagales bacterium]|nr:KpsF/GutQ family sugar-phosphate isomerase [Chitinophagales bacterium]
MKISATSILRTAKETLTIEADAILELVKTLDRHFPTLVESIYYSKGRVVVTGIGKSAIIANKLVATLNSTGTSSMFMHAADAIHGDLGMVREEDIIICISKSGESPEIKLLVPLVKNSGNLLVAMVGNMKSYLARHADLVLNTTVSKEACPNNLAPTASTTAQMAMGDALAVCLLRLRGFSPADFAKFHPGGALGKQLYLRVSDLYVQHQQPGVYEDDSIQKVILEITSGRLGATAVLNKKKQVTGIITDGDLRRMMERKTPTDRLKAKDIMGRQPLTISKDELALNALELMRGNKITQVIVKDKNQYVGMVHVHDLLKEGLV